MYCHKCGTKVNGDMRFCPKCGTALTFGSAQGSVGPSPQAEADSRSAADGVEFKQTVTDEAFPGPFVEPAGTGEGPDEHGPSKLKKWWDKSSTSKRVLGVIVAVAVTILTVIFLISFLREFGYLLLGLLIVASFVIILVKGNQEERSEAKKTIIQIALWGVAIFAAVILFATNTDFFTDLVKPGASVREAYLTQYSKTVTIEDAFDDFFRKRKMEHLQGEWIFLCCLQRSVRISRRKGRREGHFQNYR